MDKQRTKEKLIADFLGESHEGDAAMLEKDTLEFIAKFNRVNQPPMPGWKKKLYLIVGSLFAVWVLVQYLHYEACREKYPNAAAWVCVMSPK